MIRYLLSLLFLMTLLGSLPHNARSAEFDFRAMVDDLNVSAHSDPGGFRLGLATDFGIPRARVDRLIAEVGSAGDAYLCLKVGALSGRSIEEVVRVRRANPGAGWGKVAQQLGIKPGSEAFHELKQKPRKGGQGNDEKKHKDKKNKNK